MDEMHAQVQVCLKTLIREGKLATLDDGFARELAETEHLSAAQIVVATRMLRRYGCEVPDAETVLRWAIGQPDVISEEDLAALVPHSAPLVVVEHNQEQEGGEGAEKNEQTPAKRVSLQEGRLFIEFPFERAKVNAMQPLKEVIEDWAFNRYGRNEWSFPASAAVPVFDTLRLFQDFSYSPEALELAAQVYRKEALERQVREIEEHWRMLERLTALEAARPYLDGGPVANGQRLFRHQREAVQRMIEAPQARFILAHDMGLGKAQPLTAKILTPIGWKPMGQIMVGDEVINSQGGTSHVIGVFPQGEKDIYRVTFSDGSSTECCDEHLWTVNTPQRKWRGASSRVLPLKELRQSLVCLLQPRKNKGKNVLYQHFIPMVKPVEFREQELPLHPYLLGALLGDGSLSKQIGVGITSADQELLGEICQYLPMGVGLRQYRATTNSTSTWGLSIGNIGGGLNSNPVIEALRKLKLQGRKSHDKFIPSRYLFASVSSRIALLQGLLDTDGCVRREDNNIEFSTSSPMLAVDVSDLVQSLGGKATVRNPCSRFYTTPDGERHKALDAYRMSIILPPGIAPFRLSRKALLYRSRPKYQPSGSSDN